MTRGLAELDWEDVTEYAPAVVTALTMPLTFSIANGIAFGFISYAAVKLLAGRPDEAQPAVVRAGRTLHQICRIVSRISLFWASKTHESLQNLDDGAQRVSYYRCALNVAHKIASGPGLGRNCR